MTGKPLRLPLDAFLRTLHRSARSHTNGYHHYTTMSSFLSMLDSGRVYFSLLRESNDGGEYNSDCHYMMCFNYGREESIALWSLYGVPRNESIRLTFPRHDIMEWLESVRSGELEFYAVEGKNRAVPLKGACPKVSICDVAYYGNGIFTHNEKNYLVAKGKKSGFDPNGDSKLAPYVKKWGWSFEREVRIVIEFEKPVLNSKRKPYKHIAVDFDEPLQALRDGCGEIRLGPWCRRSEKSVQKKGFTKAVIKPSDFANRVHLRTECVGCDKAKRKACICKYKERGL